MVSKTGGGGYEKSETKKHSAHPKIKTFLQYNLWNKCKIKPSAYLLESYTIHSSELMWFGCYKYCSAQEK